MEKSYKFRVYPTSSQRERIERTFGCRRYVYNHFLELCRARFELDGSGMDFRERLGELKALKRDCEWLLSVNAGALVNALDELKTDFNRFVRRAGGAPEFPEPKRKKSVRQSYRVNGTGVSVEAGTVRIPSVGATPCRISRQIEGRITSASVLRSASGYYVVLSCADIVQRKLPKTGRSRALSAPEPSSPDKRLGRLRRGLSRKTIDGQNWEKLNLRAERIAERDSNRETDRWHKLSTALIRENDAVRIEGRLPERLKRQLLYKSQWYGRSLRRS